MPSDVHNLVCCVQILDCSSNGPKPFYASPGVTIIKQKWNLVIIKNEKWLFRKNSLDLITLCKISKMAWLFFFYQWNKIATLHKSRILQAVQKLRVFVGGFRTPQKGSQSRSNFRKCIISRVVSFLLLELLVVWRYTKIWRPYELAASKQKIGQIIDSLSSKQHRARPGLQNDAANCN